MNKEQINKNLKHGYIFLSLIVLTPFAISFLLETYHSGGFKFLFQEDNTPSSYPITITTNPSKGKPKLEIQGLTDGFKTKESSISIVAQTDTDITEGVINNETIKVDDSGRFERKVDLIVGQNQITVSVKNDAGENSISFSITREEEPKPMEPQPVVQEPVTQPQQNPTPQPTPEPIPQPSQITGLKMNCSITNTHPSVGQSVSVNCKVVDQNDSPVNGAFGYITVSWVNGNTVYTLSQSDGSGNMNASFDVPSGNSGSVTGNVNVAKDGLNVSSNFNLIVQ